MLVLDMIYVDWIVKKEKIYRYLRCLSHALDPLGLGAWQTKPKKLLRLAMVALGIFLGWSLRNLNYKKINKETIWIYQGHKNKNKKHANTRNFTIFFGTNKENKKKKRLIKDKVQIENADLRIIKWP